MKSHCCSASASATECEALRALHSRIPTQTGMLQPVSQHLSGHWIQAFVRNNQTRKKRRSKHQIWISDSICCDSFVLTSDSVSHFSLSLILYCLPLFLSRSLFSFSFASFFVSAPHSLLRSTPLLAPEQNEPPLHSGSLFLWQCEQASKSAGYCSANV